LNTIKAVWDKPVTDTLNNEKFRLLPKIKKKIRMPTLTASIQQSTASPSQRISQEKE
jgi:hypothetical protein